MKALFPITIIALFAALSFSSCKKDHTCTCKVEFPGYTTNNGGVITSYIGYDTTINYDLDKQSKRDAKNSCNSDQTSLRNTYMLINDSATVNCSI